MSSPLRIGLLSIARKDSSPMRSSMLLHYLDRHPWAALVWQFLETIRHTRLGRTLIIAKSLFDTFRYRWQVSGSATVLVSHYTNERRALARQFPHSPNFIQFGPGLVWTETHTRWLLAVLRLRHLAPVFRCVRLLAQRYPLLVVVRQTQFLLSYSFFTHARLSTAGHSASTESNPEVLGPLLAAQRQGVSTTFVNHGLLDSELGIFAFNHYCLSGEAIWERIQPLQRTLGATVKYFAVTPRQALRLPRAEELQRVLIFAPIVLKLDLLHQLLSDLRQHWPRVQIFLRQHPNQEMSHRDLQRCLPRDVLLTNEKNPFITDLVEIDCCIGGGSSAHLEALSAGVPTAYYRLDDLPADHYGFLARRLIPSIQTTATIVDELRRTYMADGWAKVFRHYQHD